MSEDRPTDREQEERARERLYGEGSPGAEDVPPAEELPSPETYAGQLGGERPASEQQPAEPDEEVESPESGPVEPADDSEVHAAEHRPPPDEGPPADPQATAEADALGPADARDQAADEARAALEAAASVERPPPATAAGRAGAAAAAQGPAAPAKPVPRAPTPSPPVATGGGPPGEADDDAKPPKPGLWPRFLAASFVIVICMAAATATSVLLYLTDIAEGLGGLPGVEDKLAQVEGGDPQTILILGSDRRPGEGDRGRSDTTMLLRLDADDNVLALWSLPRDLKVNIPGYGLGRLNEAYTLGGHKLTLETVKALTGLPIAHLVVVDYSGFARAVDAIGCVYLDVDRDYFHSNEGLAAELQYSEIDIDSGYQRLCGPDALAYVRYRHEDNDIIRAARQQDFLREARAKVPPEEIWDDRHELIDIFTDYVTSDVDDPVVMLEVLKLFIEIRSVPVNRVEFETNLGGPDSLYVTASNEAIQKAKREFLAGEADTGPAAGGGDGGAGGGGKPEQGGGEEPEPGGGEEPAEPLLIDSSEAAERFALEFDEDLNFPVYAPTRLAEGSEYWDVNDDSHAYGLDAPNETFGAYKLVFRRVAPFTAYGADEYYGVMGTRWKDPFILDNPSETREIDGREYLLFYDGVRLRLVGWKTDDGSYWITNTLTRSLDENEMLGIAQSMRAYSPEK